MAHREGSAAPFGEDLRVTFVTWALSLGFAGDLAVAFRAAIGNIRDNRSCEWDASRANELRSPADNWNERWDMSEYKKRHNSKTDPGTTTHRWRGIFMP